MKDACIGHRKPDGRRLNGPLLEKETVPEPVCIVSRRQIRFSSIKRE